MVRFRVLFPAICLASVILSPFLWGQEHGQKEKQKKEETEKPPKLADKISQTEHQIISFSYIMKKKERIRPFDPSPSPSTGARDPRRSGCIWEPSAPSGY